jgi:hypothetical protein
MRDWLIGTGFYASAANAAKAAEFSRLWDRCNAVAPVVVVDNSDNGFETKHRVIRVEKNLGHYIQIWNKPDADPDGPMLCGWSISWIIPALIAYSENRDFVYIEQDCLCLGDWVGQLKSDIASTGAKVLIGSPSGGQSSEVSLFWMDRDYIPWAIREYMVRPGDNKMLTEDKFWDLGQRSPRIVAFHSLGPGRNKPIPSDGAASVQYLNDQEIEWIIKVRKL